MIDKDSQFAGKVAIVTGAGTGIGAATARVLARRGARVAVLGDVAGPVDQVADEIKDAGGEAMAITVDVSSIGQVEEAVARSVERFGALHLAANCAGISSGAQSVGETDTESWRRVNAVNLDGVFNAMRHELPAIIAAGGGAIVNVSSMFGSRGLPFRSGYTASKHGVIGLSRAAAIEYGERGVRINVLSPGVIDTPMLDSDREASEATAAQIPMRRIGKPEEIARAIAFLLSEEASYITGTTLGVDGGILS